MDELKKIRVIGLGPGASDYLLPIAKQKASECNILFGSQRALNLFQDLNVCQMEFKDNLTSYIPLLQAEPSKQKGVVVTGDPGFYSLLAFLRKHFSEDNLEVIPGISSLQYLFARIATPWQDYHLTSCHGRQIGDLLGLLASSRKLALLTDNENTPAKICQQLLGTCYEDFRVIVGENLSYDDEKITISSVKEVAKMQKFSLAVVIIDDQRPAK